MDAVQVLNAKDLERGGSLAEKELAVHLRLVFYGENLEV